MKAQQTRRGGRHVLIERGGREVAIQVREQPAPAAQQAATAPLFEHAKIQAGAVLKMAKVCEVSIPEFVRRYV